LSAFSEMLAREMLCSARGMMVGVTIGPIPSGWVGSLDAGYGAMVARGVTDRAARLSRQDACV